MPSTRAAVTTSLVFAAGALAWVASQTRAAVERCWRWLGTAVELVRSAARRVAARARDAAAGPVREFAAGPVRTALLGRRTDVSLLVALTAPALAAVAAWWVIAAVGGYETLAAWTRGTWAGTAPSVALVLAVTLVLAAGAASAAANSGLVPTTTLVAGPVFGAVLTRYGTETGATVVSLPDAVAVATGGALFVGVPFGVTAFCLGAAVRRVVRTVAGGSGGAGRPEGA
jgi:hypothetical protein